MYTAATEALDECTWASDPIAESLQEVNQGSKLRLISGVFPSKNPARADNIGKTQIKPLSS
jgi:hypothetical protein